MSYLPALRILATGLVCTASLRAAPVEIVPPEFTGAVQPQIATAPGGRVHVVFGRGTGIFYAGSADGRTFSKPVKVGDIENLALGMRRGPRIAATDQVIAVTAISHADGNIHAWTSSDGGATWQEKPKLNDTESVAREGLHATAGDGRGFVFAAWLDLRNGAKELWSASSTDGGETWGANALVYKSPDGSICQCCHPSAAVDASGRVAVMWRNSLGGSRDLYFAWSADRGKTFAAAQKLGEGTWKLNACPMDGGSIALGPKGEPITVWRRDRSIFSSDSSAPERRLAASGTQPLVFSTAAGETFLWESGGALIVQKNSAPPATFAGHARMAAGASLPRGGTIVVWESTSGGAGTILADSLP